MVVPGHGGPAAGKTDSVGYYPRRLPLSWDCSKTCCSKCAGLRWSLVFEREFPRRRNERQRTVKQVIELCEGLWWVVLAKSHIFIGVGVKSRIGPEAMDGSGLSWPLVRTLQLEHTASRVS